MVIFGVPACIIVISLVLSPALIVTDVSRVNPSFGAAPIRNPVFLLPDAAESDSQSAVLAAVQVRLVLTTIKLASFSAVNAIVLIEIPNESTVTIGGHLVYHPGHRVDLWVCSL